jgi:hypothetical protein
MTTEHTAAPQPISLSSVLMFLAAAGVLAAAGFGLYKFSSYVDGKGDALALSLVVLVGLALVIALMAGLTMVYSLLGVENRQQPLALPEGSVRALIAFSLLLIFVCLATFIYAGAKGPELLLQGKVTRITAAQVAELRKEFVIVEEPARKADGTPDTEVTGGTSTPLSNASYYIRQRTKEGDDIGKQIFTTLATVFVSVVSFYFGSSTASSGVGAGLKAAAGGRPTPDQPGTGKPSSGKTESPSTTSQSGPSSSQPAGSDSVASG